MPQSSGRRPPVGLLAVLTLLSAAHATELAAGPRIWERQQDRVTLRVRTMSPGSTSGAGQLEVTDAAPGETLLRLPWPGPGQQTDLLLKARLEPGAGESRRVRLMADLLGTDGQRTQRAERVMTVEDRTTVLFEVARSGDRVLTLAIDAELDQEKILSATPTAGAPVRFRLEVQRVHGGRAIPLESNWMNTFMGDSVTYSFRWGEHGDLESALVRLTPRELRGELLVLDVELEGSLPGAAGLDAVARTDRWFSSRGATSTLSIESGDPPSGYRFLVTAVF